MQSCLLCWCATYWFKPSIKLHATKASCYSSLVPLRREKCESISCEFYLCLIKKTTCGQCVCVPVGVCALKFPKPKPNTLSLDFCWKNFSPVAVNLNQHGQPSVSSEGNWTKLHATRDTQRHRGRVGERGGECHRMGHGPRSSCCNFICLRSLSLSLPLSLPVRRACLTCHYLMRVHKKLNQNALHAPERGWMVGGGCGCDCN